MSRDNTEAEMQDVTDIPPGSRSWRHPNRYDIQKESSLKWSRRDNVHILELISASGENRCIEKENLITLVANRSELDIKNQIGFPFVPSTTSVASYGTTSDKCDPHWINRSGITSGKWKQQTLILKTHIRSLWLRSLTLYVKQTNSFFCLLCSVIRCCWCTVSEGTWWSCT